jgi:hypothetical protein
VRSASSMRRTIAVVAALLGAGGALAAAQVAPRPAACTRTAVADSTWIGYSFQGPRLALKIPPGLKQVDPGKLGAVAKRAHAPLSQITDTDSIRPISAWEAPSKSPGELREVLLYQVRRGFVPTGRPCAMAIAGAPGLVFRLALSSEGQAADEYWIEAYWPGFVLAAAGRSFSGWELIIGLLGEVVAIP